MLRRTDGCLAKEGGSALEAQVWRSRSFWGEARAVRKRWGHAGQAIMAKNARDDDWVGDIGDDLALAAAGAGEDVDWRERA